MEVSVQCEQCEKACLEQNSTLSNPNQNRTKEICSGNGELKCGACECDENWEGKNCECGADSNKVELCMENGVCNGHGTCRCGECECHEDYLGKFCQHSKKEHCFLDDGKLVK